MKKIVLVIVALLVIAATLPTVAYASTQQECEICSYVKSKEKVVDAQCIVYQNNCVVAIKTEKFLSKTDYERFQTDLQQELENKFHLDNVAVTRSPKAMHALKRLAEMSDEEREQAIKEFIDKEFSHKPHRPHVLPRH